MAKEFTHAELVEMWVMGDEFAEEYEKARAVRTLEIHCIVENPLTLESLELPE